MVYVSKGRVALAAVIANLAAVGVANAAIIISEVSPTGSSSGTYNADWFELTNTGAADVSIVGWKMDDNSNSFAASVALRGVTTIAAGQSVVFIEGKADGSTDAAINAAFVSAWFGGNAPAYLVIGNYGGTSVGLSATTDAVNIFDASGAVVTRVDFGASTAKVSFDNAAGLNNVTLTQLSVAGVNGAYVSPTGETGSPGLAPAPASLALVGLGALVAGRRRRA